MAHGGEPVTGQALVTTVRKGDKMNGIGTKCWY